jgi:hypothetical protein
MTRIPLLFAHAPPERGALNLALVLTSPRPDPPGFALVRHAEAAAVAQAGVCACCRTPSGLATALRQLFLDRVRGAVAFEAIVIVAESDAPIGDAMRDPLVAARFALAGTHGHA